MAAQIMAHETQPTDATAPTAAQERIAVIDVLRGFALFGILVVNMASFKGSGFGALGDASVLDRAATWLIAFGFQTKFYVLFSFLFGYGLSVQMTRAAARGNPVVPRFVRRLVFLLLLGLLHGLLLYTGDILVTYALLGVILLLLRNAADRVLLRVAVALVAGTVGLVVLGGVALATLSSGTTVPPEASAAIGSSVAAYRGTPSEVIAARVRDYPGTLAFAVFGQGPTALAMFLVGLWAGRRRLLERVDAAVSLLRRVLAVGLALGVPGAIVWATFRVVNGFSFDARFLWAVAVDFATAPFLSAVYAATLILVYRRADWQRWLAALAPVGRMSLSNYLLQSLVAAFVFTGYGLRWYGQTGAAQGLALSVLIFAVQLPLSAWWLRHFQFGPPSGCCARSPMVGGSRSGFSSHPAACQRGDGAAWLSSGGVIAHIGHIVRRTLLDATGTSRPACAG